MMIGRNAIFGIGKPTEIIGSKNQRAILQRDIAHRKRDAADCGDGKTSQARNSVKPRLIQRSPLDRIVIDMGKHDAESAAA